MAVADEKDDASKKAIAVPAIAHIVHFPCPLAEEKAADDQIVDREMKRSHVARPVAVDKPYLSLLLDNGRLELKRW